MKKNKSFAFLGILVVLLGIGTIILFWIVYKDINSSIAFKFVIGYLVLGLLMILYVTIIIILKLRKLKWVETRKILIKFMAWFILIFIFKYSLLRVFVSSNVDLSRVIPGAVCMAIGISYIDFTFFRKKEKLE